MSKRFPALLVVFLMSAVSLFAAPKTEEKVSSEPQVSQAGSYVAERAIIRDVKTGQLRKPTIEETAELVSSLKAMTRRDPALLQAAAASGSQKADLQGQYEMVVLVRPTEDGGNETLCVSSFEEAATFLGLRFDPATKPGKEAQQ